MRKFYIIPGWQETTRRKQYQELAKAVNTSGFQAILKNVDWAGKLSEQKFAVEKDSILFGFSMGALLARLIAQDQKVSLVIFASPTPLKHFKGGKDEKDLKDVIGGKMVDDIKNNLMPRIKSRGITMYGDLEGETADIIVAGTDHKISDNYIREILKII